MRRDDRFPELTLYSRAWCHLCEQMLAELRSLAVADLRVEVIDIEGDAELERRFGEEIPVLMHGEVELCRHRLDAGRVRAYLSDMR